jgi:hypothetical protein
MNDHLTFMRIMKIHKIESIIELCCIVYLCIYVGASMKKD